MIIAGAIYSVSHKWTCQIKWRLEAIGYGWTFTWGMNMGWTYSGRDLIGLVQTTCRPHNGMLDLTVLGYVYQNKIIEKVGF